MACSQHIIFTPDTNGVVKNFKGSHRPSSWRLPQGETWWVTEYNCPVGKGQKYFFPFALQEGETLTGGLVEVTDYQGGYPDGCPKELKGLYPSCREGETWGANEVPPLQFVS